jgi:hypothetical protein
MIQSLTSRASEYMKRRRISSSETKADTSHIKKWGKGELESAKRVREKTPCNQNKQRRRVGLKKGNCTKGNETRTGDVFFQVRHGYRHLLSFSCPPLQFSNFRKAHQGSKGKKWKQTATGHETNAAEGKQLTYYNCAPEGAKRFSRSWKMASFSFLFFWVQFLWSTQSGDDP